MNLAGKSGALFVFVQYFINCLLITKYLDVPGIAVNYFFYCGSWANRGHFTCAAAFIVVHRDLQAILAVKVFPVITECFQLSHVVNNQSFCIAQEPGKRAQMPVNFPVGYFNNRVNKRGEIHIQANAVITQNVSSARLSWIKNLVFIA
jgi:hypothetical protein